MISTKVSCATVLPAKSDSDFMFCSQNYQGLIIDRSLVYRIGLIHKLSIDSRQPKWSEKVNVLLRNCKQNNT